MPKIVVFHDPGMKLTRQTQDRHHGQQQGGDKTLGKQGGLENLENVILQRHLLPHIQGAVENKVQAVKPQQHEGHHFDKGLEADRQHQTGLVLRGIDMAGSEQQGKHRHQYRHQQRGIHIVLRGVLEHVIE